MINTKILQKVIDCYGEKEQIEMAIEECSGLINALQKYKQSVDGTEKEKTKAKFNVCDAIANVNITVNMLYLIFDATIIKFTEITKMSQLIRSIVVKHITQHKN